VKSKLTNFKQMKMSASLNTANLHLIDEVAESVMGEATQMDMTQMPGPEEFNRLDAID
jgi:hypothetical protein